MDFYLSKHVLIVLNLNNKYKHYFLFKISITFCMNQVSNQKMYSSSHLKVEVKIKLVN